MKVVKILILLFWTGISFGQTPRDTIPFTYPDCDTVFLTGSQKGYSYMSDALLVKANKIALITVHLNEAKAKKSTIFVLDYEHKKLVSKIELNTWRYEYQSWVAEDSLLYLAKGRLFSKIDVFNLYTGEKIESKLESRYDKPLEGNGQAEYFGNKELFCSGNVVYDNTLEQQVSMLFNFDLQAMLIYTYRF